MLTSWPGHWRVSCKVSFWFIAEGSTTLHFLMFWHFTIIPVSPVRCKQWHLIFYKCNEWIDNRTHIFLVHVDMQANKSTLTVTSGGLFLPLTFGANRAWYGWLGAPALANKLDSCRKKIYSINLTIITFVGKKGVFMAEEALIHDQKEILWIF